MKLPKKKKIFFQHFLSFFRIYRKFPMLYKKMSLVGQLFLELLTPKDGFN